MDNRVKLHRELEQFGLPLYFSPPADKTMAYPCIVYSKVVPSITFANDRIYKNAQEYQLTVVEKDPDSNKADLINGHFRYSLITNKNIIDKLYQTNIKLYY